MHPAYSVILFTTASGAGYGLMFLLGLGHAFGLVPEDRWFLFTAMALALVLVTVGLLSSTAHLGHPERAWRAFSQWRSSWLSREGVVAVATYIPAGLLALVWLVGISGNVLTAILGLLAAIGAAATVYCTGMIYQSLRTIRQWNLSQTTPVYLLLALATGAVLLGLIMALFGYVSSPFSVLVRFFLVLGAAIKVMQWEKMDVDQGQYTAEMATGLGQFGEVRPLDPPHTRPNFVMREMGYQVARKHGERLRYFCIGLLFVVPFILIALAFWFEAGFVLCFVLATLSAAIGVVMERWLFFGQAEHVSMLYYGQSRA